MLGGEAGMYPPRAQQRLVQWDDGRIVRLGWASTARHYLALGISLDHSSAGRHVDEAGTATQAEIVS